MDIHTYLAYNNVALIDPSEDFHASCIKQFEKKGYLSANQLLSLRNWAHSVETIERLTAGVQPHTTTPVAEPAVEEPKRSTKKWTNSEIQKLEKCIENGTTALSELSALFNRKESSIQNLLYRTGECTIKKGKILQYEPIPF